MSDPVVEYVGPVDGDGYASGLRTALANRFPAATVETVGTERWSGGADGVDAVVLDVAGVESSGATVSDLLRAIPDGDQRPVVLLGDIGAGVPATERTAVTAVVDRDGATSARVVAAAIEGALNGSGDADDAVPSAEAGRQPADGPDRTAVDPGLHRTILETVEDGVYVLDPDGRFITVNDAYCRLTGQDPEDLIGEPASTIGDGSLGEIQDTLQDRLESGTGVETFELDLPRSDGRTVPVEARVSLFPLDGDYGRVGVIRDLSERRQLERELGQTLERVTDAFFALNEDWEFTYVNGRAEMLLQRTEDELEGRVIWDEFPEAIGTAFQDQYERAMDAQEQVTFDAYYPPLEGHFEVNAYPSPSGLSVYFRDITDRIEGERELQQRLEQQAASADLGRMALESGDLDALMRKACRAVADGLDNDYCKVLELDAESRELLLRQGVGWDDGIVRSATVAADERSQAGYTLQTEGPVVVEDLPSEERFSGPELLTSHGVRSGISVVIGPSDDPWGILGTHDTESKSFSRYDVAFVTSVATLLWTAIERHALESDLRRQRDLSQRMLETAPVGILVLDEDRTVAEANERAEAVVGVPFSELRTGERSFRLLDVEGNELPPSAFPTARVIDDGESVEGEVLKLVRPDGETRWLSVSGSRLLGDGDDAVRGIFTIEDVTGARERAARLEALNERSRRLLEAETTDEVCTTAVEAAREALDLPCTYLMRYDEREGSLELAAATDEAVAVLEDPLLGDLGDSPVWDAFIRREQVVVEDVDDPEHAPGVGSVAALPIGEHGVLVTFVPAGEERGLSETDLLLADMLGATTQSSLDRAGREAALRRQRDTLEEKNDRLDRVNRANRAIRDIMRVLLQANTNEEIERLVCERLADIDLYRFVWIGHHDRADDRIVQVASAGEGADYLDVVTVTADETATGQGPSGQAIAAGETQVENDIVNAPTFGPWREAALTRGFRSSIAVPIRYRETTYGVLNLYAGKPGAFGEMEREVLQELGRTIGYAMSGLERKQALVSESSVELRFAIGRFDSPPLGFVDDTGGEFTLENVVQRLDGYLHVFFTVEGVDFETVRERAERSPDVDHVTYISGVDGGGWRGECALRESAFLSTLIDRGARIESVVASEGRAELTIRVPQSADVRRFVEELSTTFDDVDLLARRERDEPVMTREAFENEVRGRLTDRQEEVIRTAYYSGFFEWPRRSNGQDVAELLGVTQPTVNRHIRAGERTVFGLLFDDEDEAGGD